MQGGNFDQKYGMRADQYNNYLIISSKTLLSLFSNVQLFTQDKYNIINILANIESDPIPY